MFILEGIGMLIHVYQKIVIGRLSFLGRPENLSSEVKHQSQVLVLVEVFGTASKARLFFPFLINPYLAAIFDVKVVFMNINIYARKFPIKTVGFGSIIHRLRVHHLRSDMLI